MQNPSVITCGLTRESRARLSQFLNGCEEQVFAPDQLVAILESPPEQEPVAVFCGNEMTDPPPMEAAQFLRSQFQSAPIFFITDGIPNFDRRTYIKNGYTDTFSLTVDEKLLHRAMSEALAKARGTTVYRPARLMDISPDEALDFDTAIYLPGNDRYIRMSHAGQSMGRERIEKLKNHGFRSIHVPADQMKAYHLYAARRLKGLESAGLTPEALEKRAASVRELLAGVMVELEQEATFSEGRAAMTQASDIIASYLQGTASASCYQRILELSDEGADAYAHASNVSTIAALIALGTGKAKPEHLALAGLLHEVGSAPQSEGAAQIAAQIAATLEVIRKRKILLPQEVTRAIAEHYERFDGLGGPDGKAGSRISKEAQILAMADAIDRWSAVVPGRPRRAMLDWVKEQREHLAKRARPGAFDPVLLAQVLELFPPTP
ncbi:MAG: HD-GYP domain-containing protein [Oligoflexia bacterium]